MHTAESIRPASATRVPLARLDNSDSELISELLGAIEGVARSAAFTLGEEVAAFEEEFAAYCGTDHAVGVSSGTEALALSLRALDVGSGDEVLVPTNSFVATAEAVALVGATPVFVDVEVNTQLVTADLLAASLGPRVRALIPVHLFGRTVDMAPILQLAREHQLHVIEDAAQAHGARYRGRPVGSLGDCGCFSFYPSKNLGAWGDGGAVTTSDRQLARRIRLLRSHGEEPRHHHLELGTTARLDAIQAAILRIKLRRLDEQNELRRRRARDLDAALAGILAVPSPPGPGRDHVYHQYVVRSESRDLLREHLSARGIASAIHYPTPIHSSPAFHVANNPPLPVAEHLAQTICSLPIYPSMTDDELELIVAACRSFENRASRHAA